MPDKSSSTGREDLLALVVVISMADLFLLMPEHWQTEAVREGMLGVIAVGRPLLGDCCWRTDAGGPMLEDRCWRTDAGEAMLEGRRKTDAEHELLGSHVE